MLYNYTTPDYATTLVPGVVLQEAFFQLFDLEHNKEWEQYAKFDPIPNPKYDSTKETDFDNAEELYCGSYGVCDHLENLMSTYPELQAEGRTFVVSMTAIRKEDQEAWGGWRWHKWGEYIGTQKPTCEYMHDEPEIDLVYCFHIYEKIA